MSIVYAHLLGGVYDASQEEHNDEEDRNDGDDNVSNVVTESQHFLSLLPTSF